MEEVTRGEVEGEGGGGGGKALVDGVVDGGFRGFVSKRF